MPPTANRLSSASLSGRRLFSHLTSQIGAKTRHVQDYHITVDDPHKQYAPGDSVTGAVHLTLQKAVRITHLVVCLHGFAQVYKTPGVPPADGYRANNVRVGTGTGSKSGEYFGNGFATLFEDEVILCGDGRLDDGAYQFNFHLEFPDRDLPSSISFERGTISYMITATLTRPTTISPTLQCDHKVYMVEKIDISQLLPPKPRTITLEPLSLRGRAKSQAQRLVENDRQSRRADQVASPPQIDRLQRTGSQASSTPSVRTPGGSPAENVTPSEISFDSLTGSQGRPSQQGSNATSPGVGDPAAQNDGSRGSLQPKMIIAEVESLAGGCLRGQQIPVRVHVDHTKHVKSLHGVIITLYRQARVDMHPVIPLGPTEKGKEDKYEDYYPKSITGLGGLSLSGAGSSHTFRKDLAQSVFPLIVDPISLTAEVSGKIHIPDEAFPTIASVPGNMISFRYYIEVVLDIQGKLSSQDRNFGNLGGFASTMAMGPGSSSLGLERAPNGEPVIDTTALRRNKGVVACTFEIVVGTKDSQRRRGKQPKPDSVDHGTSNAIPPESNLAVPPTAMDGHHELATPPNAWLTPDPSYYHPQYYHADPSIHYQYHGRQDGYYDEGRYLGPSPAHGPTGQAPVPIPPIEDDAQLSEKERIRRAETRLLPSQPPNDPGSSPAVEGVAGSAAGPAPSPTAPYLHDELAHTYALPPLPPQLPALPYMPPTFSYGTITPLGTATAPDSSAYRNESTLTPTTAGYEAREGNGTTASHAVMSTARHEHTEGQVPTGPTSVAAMTRPPSSEERDRRVGCDYPNGGMASVVVAEEEETGSRRRRGERAQPLGREAAMGERDELYLDEHHDSHAELPRYER